MHRTWMILAATLLFATGCAHDNGRHKGQDHSAMDHANDTARDAGSAVREAAGQTNRAVTDFLKGLTGND